MPLFRKKPVVIEAVQFTGNNAEACGLEVTVTQTGIQTLEGFMSASPGDWIITGVKGERYPCKPDIFAATYEAATPLERVTMDFGEAVRALKAGKRVARAGWNGKGMWLAYQKAYPDGIPINANTAEATGIPQGTVCKFLPYLMMKTAGGEFVPWLASQTDVLAEDWSVVAS